MPSSYKLGLLDFFFDDSTLDDKLTLEASIRMFADLNLIEKFQIDYKVSSIN